MSLRIVLKYLDAVALFW